MERKHSWEQETSSGTKIVLWILSAALGVVVVLGIVNGWFGGGPPKNIVPDSVLAERYEWGVNLARQIDVKRVALDSLEAKKADIEKANAKKPQKKWSRKVKEQYGVLDSLISLNRSEHDKLAKEYNAEMSKWNWRFAKPDSLPQGITTPLSGPYKLFSIPQDTGVDSKTSNSYHETIVE
ncbi:hypothetical protein HY967_04800 [Candidatus Jorgensenbacteria bacterium]|nr:hypothetical protein [Candidatus Jorgensenbacteria bacterium]